MPRHPKYKTERCKTFWKSGGCPYGTRCRFLHEDAADKKQDNSAGGEATSEGQKPRNGIVRPWNGIVGSFEVEKPAAVRQDEFRAAVSQPMEEWKSGDSAGPGYFLPSLSPHQFTFSDATLTPSSSLPDRSEATLFKFVFRKSHIQLGGN